MLIEWGEGFQRIGLMALLILWAVFLLGGFLTGKLNDDGTHRTRTWTRMASSIVLVAAGWSQFLFARETEAGGFAFLVAVGMSFGCLGDLFMAKLMPVRDPVLGGIGSFSLGHLAYIGAIVSFSGQYAPAGAGTLWIPWIVMWLMIGGVSWYFAVYRGQTASVLHYAALGYALLLATTAAVGSGLGIQLGGLRGLGIGTILFMMSDLILAAQLFRHLHFRLIGDVVWLLYGPAQMLIVYSVGAALGIVR